MSTEGSEKEEKKDPVETFWDHAPALNAHEKRKRYIEICPPQKCYQLEEKNPVAFQKYENEDECLKDKKIINECAVEWDNHIAEQNLSRLKRETIIAENKKKRDAEKKRDAKSNEVPLALPNPQAPPQAPLTTETSFASTGGAKKGRKKIKKTRKSLRKKTRKSLRKKTRKYLRKKTRKSKGRRKRSTRKMKKMRKRRSTRR